MVWRWKSSRWGHWVPCETMKRQSYRWTHHPLPSCYLKAEVGWIRKSPDAKKQITKTELAAPASNLTTPANGIRALERSSGTPRGYQLLIKPGGFLCIGLRYPTCCPTGLAHLAKVQPQMQENWGTTQRWNQITHLVPWGNYLIMGALGR